MRNIMVEQIVGRLHVATGLTAVLRYYVSCLKNGKATWKKLERKERAQLWTAIIKTHRRNRDEYAQVMWHRDRWL